MAKFIEILNLVDDISNNIKFYKKKFDDEDCFDYEFDTKKIELNLEKIKDIINENIMINILNSEDRSMEYNHGLFISLINNDEIDPKKYIVKFKNYGTVENIYDILLKANYPTTVYFLSINKDNMRNKITQIIDKLGRPSIFFAQDYSKLECVLPIIISLYGDDKNLSKKNILSELLCELYNVCYENTDVYLMLIKLGADVNYTEKYLFTDKRMSFLEKINENNFINIPIIRLNTFVQ